MARKTSRRRRSTRRSSLRRNPPISFSPETVALAHKVYGVKKNGRRRRSSRRDVRCFCGHFREEHSISGGCAGCDAGGKPLSVIEHAFRAGKLYRNSRRRSSRRLVSLFKNKQGRYASHWGSVFGKKSKRKTSRKHTSARRRPSRASVRRTSRRLGGMFGMPARFKSTLRKPRRKSRRRTSKSRKAPGLWRITVKGKLMPKKFRSSRALLAYARKRYGRGGFKWGWGAQAWGR